ncbi:MAG: hypothetical protein GBAus27B_000283 [Mycoplasmataceae bacterium]|nr:MAG: hypothetical protein GBAus27B_000283 [Mycoplasmataceae bacterium]
MVNAQIWLDAIHSNKQKTDKIELNTESNCWAPKNENDVDLQGELLISDYSNLKIIRICKTSINKVKIVNCPKLEFAYLSRNEITDLEVNGKFNELKGLVCENNSLTNIILPDEAKKLGTLFLAGNNLKQDLSLFSKFTNLWEIRIYDNGFYGSLKPLKNLKRLDFLQIEHTDIDSGLEYLPDSLRRFSCDCWCDYCDRPDSVCRILDAQLSSYGGDKGRYLDWREKNQDLILKARLEGLSKEEELIELNKILAKQLLKANKSLEKEKKDNQNLKELNSQLIQKLKEKKEQVAQIETLPK